MNLLKRHNILFFVIILFYSLIFTGCAVGPTHGYIVTETQFPGTFNPENNVKADKEAKGCQYTVLYLVTYGDAGAGSIAFKNGITKIATIDHSTFSLFSGLIRNYCTFVVGE
ncbi:TRL-like family protein [Leptospira levettii]|uniref:TRL-like family protein n=1 Tax=Leptospira levettii TaxID=2023178 RepID=A0A5F2AGS0_9LEPT|nr:TRL-like family protein [Leptospira levettii]PKA27115.1 TRL-like family protein [Leptospira sp. mixed culture ATI2-C-A1]MCG6146915.1 TRL-like family protein [Leptospira levettii]MCW7465791.1 TRL-like family protein [Leptospira levettii]MCW7496629.1 TRL-like family protein [Leptospira levettii]MCW7506994.1 TRL-like family protein [Leptospira levettii]